MTRVLLVDDEPQLLRALSINLRARAFEVVTAATGAGALEVASRARPDVVVLDLGLPDMDGVDVIIGLRAWTTVPVLVLSARRDTTDKVRALDAGADDYLAEPFAMDDLLARLRATARRGPPRSRSRRSSRRRRSRSTWPGASSCATVRPCTSPRPEWRLVEVLARHVGRLVGQRQLLQEVWGLAYETKTNYLRIYLAKLRKKLEPEPSRPRHLLTELGLGVRLQP